MSVPLPISSPGASDTASPSAPNASAPAAPASSPASAPASPPAPLPIAPSTSPSRIFGAGEMADLIRAFDWSTTPLGPIESWGDPLLTCVNLMLASRNPMYLWWGPDAIQLYNDAYRPSFGPEKHPGALGEPGRESWPLIWDRIQAGLDLVMRHGQSNWYENQLVPMFRNGRMEDVYWNWSDSPVRDAAGNIVGVMVTCTETTGRVIAERELNRSRERLQLALEAAELGTWWYNPRAQTFTADAAMQRMFGAPDATGDHDFWQQILHPEDRRAAREEFEAALAGVRPYNLQYRVLHPDGVRWIRSKGKVMTAEDETKGMFATVEDITQSKLAEIELRARARDLRESERIGKMGSWHLVLATGVLTWSEEVYRILEHDPRLPVLDYAKQPELMEADSLLRLQDAVGRCIATGQSYELDTKMYLPNGGKTVWLSTRGEPVFDAAGKVVELRGTVRDITDRKLVEEALRSSEERLQLALEAACLGTWSYDAGTGIGIGDATMRRLFGASQAAGDPDYWLSFIHPDDRPAVEAEFQAAIAGLRPYKGEYRILSPDKGAASGPALSPTNSEVRWIRSMGRIIEEPGRPLRLAAIVEDVTDRKRTEAVLLRTEKLAAVGRLASSIAHEINNPLESVTNLIYLARFAESLEQCRELLALADSELRRVSAITSQTLRFHRQSTRPTLVTCDDLLSNALVILRSRLVNANVKVEQRLRATRPVVCFDGEIRQVIYNLLINAVDAMQPRGGRLLLRSREGHDHASGRGGLILTIADTGAGMSADTLSKIFEPFYTTKGVAGTGLGLWISKEIVDRHQGRLRVRTSQRPTHTGTVFNLFLPFEPAER